MNDVDAEDSHVTQPYSDVAELRYCGKPQSDFERYRHVTSGASGLRLRDLQEPSNERAPAVDACLGEEFGHVKFDGPLLDPEFLGDGLVAVPSGHQFQDGPLPRRQSPRATGGRQGLRNRIFGRTFKRQQGQKVWLRMTGAQGNELPVFARVQLHQTRSSSSVPIRAEKVLRTGVGHEDIAIARHYQRWYSD